MSAPSSPTFTAPKKGILLSLLKRPLAALSLLVLLAIVASAIFLPIILKTTPHLTSPDTFQPPSAIHLFGTDINGRDVFARTLEGARVSLAVGFAGTIISLFIGTSVGLVAGYIGGKVDSILMRVVDVLYSIPRLILIIVTTFALHPRLVAWINASSFQQATRETLLDYSKIIILIFVLGCIEWLTMARIVRGQVLSLKTRPFIQAAHTIGQSQFAILTKHLLPNLTSIIIVYLTLTMPAVMLDEAFLSYLGLGVQAPQASWGSLLSTGADYAVNAVRSQWWLLLFPGAAMSITLLALNFLGDALRDILSDS